jgi:predicted kinase
MSKTVHILCGVSGSGKTTYAWKTWPDAFIYSADDYFTFAGEYRFDPKKLGEAHAECLQRFVDTMDQPELADVVVDNTNTTLVEIAPYVALAQAFGWAVDIRILHCTPDVAFARGRHGVPLHTIDCGARRLSHLIDDWPWHWPKPIIAKVVTE